MIGAARDLDSHLFTDSKASQPDRNERTRLGRSRFASPRPQSPSHKGVFSSQKFLGKITVAIFNKKLGGLT